MNCRTCLGVQDDLEMQTLGFMLRFLGRCVFLAQLSWTSSEQTKFSRDTWATFDGPSSRNLPSVQIITSETWEKKHLKFQVYRRLTQLRDVFPPFWGNIFGRFPPFCVFCFLKVYETHGRKIPRSTKICFRTGTGVQSGVVVRNCEVCELSNLFGWWCWLPGSRGSWDLHMRFMNVEIHRYTTPFHSAGRMWSNPLIKTSSIWWCVMTSGWEFQGSHRRWWNCPQPCADGIRKSSMHTFEGLFDSIST